MSESMNLETDSEDKIFMGSLRNLFKETYTNKEIIKYFEIYLLQ